MNMQNREGPRGDAIASGKACDTQTSGGWKREAVEDRPYVSEGKPEDSPEADRAEIAP